MSAPMMQPNPTAGPDGVREPRPHHSITSSARASRVGGMSIASALAVFRLMISSSLVGNSTGRSPGAVPCKTLAT